MLHFADAHHKVYTFIWFFFSYFLRCNANTRVREKDMKKKKKFLVETKTKWKNKKLCLLHIWIHSFYEYFALLLNKRQKKSDVSQVICVLICFKQICFQSFSSIGLHNMILTIRKHSLATFLIILMPTSNSPYYVFHVAFAYLFYHFSVMFTDNMRIKHIFMIFY